MSEHKSFSERSGYTQPKLPQLEGVDDELRVGLWNAFWDVFNNSIPKAYKLHREIFVDFFKGHADVYDDTWSDVPDLAIGDIKEFFLSAKWYEVFNLVEFVMRSLDDDSRDTFRIKCNTVLGRENSAYRIFENGIISPITSEQEIAEIETALQIPYGPAKDHLEKALAHLSDRENPDYANSIKESISAVESIAKEITGKEKSLNALTQQLQLHPNFKNALDELYNWTSQDGIRHGKSGESPETDQATARFMLVTCSAFVNYIIAGNSQT